jgi:hypothetical protein
MPASRNALTLAVLVSLWLASVGNWPLLRALTGRLTCLPNRHI